MTSEPFEVESVLEVVLSKLRTLAETGQTFGQPITVGDTVIVPYMSLNFGLAGGGGELSPDQQSKRGPHPVWSGAGGGVRIEPMGFLVIRGDKVELLTTDQKSTGQWNKIADQVVPLLQQWLQSREAQSHGKTESES